MWWSGVGCGGVGWGEVGWGGVGRGEAGQEFSRHVNQSKTAAIYPASPSSGGSGRVGQGLRCPSHRHNVSRRGGLRGKSLSSTVTSKHHTQPLSRGVFRDIEPGAEEYFIGIPHA